MKIAFIVQGLFEKSDSIGFDCIYEFKRVRTLFQDEIRELAIFAERFDPLRYPDVPVRGLDAFYGWCAEHPDGIVIYHYCGAWSEMDSFLTARASPSVIRWHNNTSPWFYFSKERYLVHTLEGFENIVAISGKPNLFFWVNSSFTQDQFVALGGQASRSSVVYPASRYLQSDRDGDLQERRFAPDGVITLLFVGRVVQHKGHKSIISMANRVFEATGKPVVVRFAGREDDVKIEIERHAATYPNVETHFHGEVSDTELEDLYRISDALICLSEHEGFGLPVFEAMRCGLPTIVWSITALRELMVDHPLGFLHYDLNMFAAAVISLQDDGCYRSVIAAQERVLQSYTAQVVDTQIADALASLRQGDARHLHAVLPAALQQEPELADAVVHFMQKARSTPTAQPDLLRDSGHNLFSRYDILAFRKFFAREERLRFASFESFEKRGRYRLDAREFQHHYGSLCDDRLIFRSDHYKNGHLIFGPYRDLPKGRYYVEFDLSISSRNLDRVIIDVASSDKGLITQALVRVKDLASRMPRLIFDCDRDGDQFEFRIKAKKPFDGAVEFRGVFLGQVSGKH